MITKKRSSGVLLNISSLNGEYSIGTFGKEVNEFCDFLLSVGCHFWQILPITAIGFYNSPYSSVSAFAGNYLYISPDLMHRDGYISYDDIEEAKYYNQKYTVDYQDARLAKRRVLEIAFSNNENTYELDNFLKEQGKWLLDYATYMTIKEAHDQKPWWEWEHNLKIHDNKAVNEFINTHKKRFYFYVFEQFIFDKQWKEQLNNIHAKGIKIIGDMPMYVANDSADIWANTKLFQMNDDLSLRAVAGVPPDYFSKDGQLWGNPLYDFDEMKKNNYKWWIDRFSRMFDLYDVLRIDHFRAFDRYWAVPSNTTTAINGKWENGPGMDLFKIVNDKFNSDRIIAEDLGTIDDSVRKLLLCTGYAGMRVLQFAFGDFESIHLIHNYPINTIAYTATHDNNTTLGWLYTLDDDTREYLFNYMEIDRSSWAVGGYNSTSVKQMIKCLYRSSAILTIVPYQDLCGFGADTRMNIPGIAESNWEFRLTEESLRCVDREFYLKNNNLFGRNNKLEGLDK